MTTVGEVGGVHCPVVVVGLPRRGDRRCAIQAMLDRVPGVQPLFAADIGAAVDWQSLDAEQIQRLHARVFPWCNPSSRIDWWNRHLKLGEIACALSHWNVWSVARTAAWPAVIVLEDDALITPGFEDCDSVLADMEQQDPSWDLLYLGRARVQPDRGKAGRFVVPGFSYCTHAYTVSARGLRKLLATGLDSAIIPVDEFLCAMFLGHPRADVRARFPPVLAAYALEEDLVLRRPKGTVDSDTEDSPFLEPHSTASIPAPHIVPRGE